MEILLIYLAIAVLNAVVKYWRRADTSDVRREKPIEYPPPQRKPYTKPISPTVIPEKSSYRQSTQKEVTIKETDVNFGIPLSVNYDALGVEGDTLEWSDMDEEFREGMSDLEGWSKPVERRTSIKLEGTTLMNGIILSEILGPPRCKRKGTFRVY